MGKICYSLGEHPLEYCEAMHRFFANDAVELRLDLLDFDEDSLKHFFRNRTGCTISTFYVQEDEDEQTSAIQKETAATQLAQAIVLGTDYVTIPYDFGQKEIGWLRHLAWNHHSRIIISYHNLYGTPSTSELKSIAQKCYALGADIVKIVTMAHHPSEAKRVLQLYDYFKAETLIAFAMGDAGTESRMESYRKGAPFLFATTLRDFSTAKGQLTFYDMIPNHDKRNLGTIYVPSSKSEAIRAIVAASLGHNKSIISNVTFCDDVVCAIHVAEQFLADIKIDDSKKNLIITGHQDIPNLGLIVKDNSIFVGESALLARLCIPLCGLCKNDITITGTGTLLKRKINDHIPVLQSHGLDISFKNRYYLPCKVSGTLTGGDFSLRGDKGSQMISGLLFALPFCKGDCHIFIKKPTSLPYILTTLAVLHNFGFEFDNCDDDDDDFSIIFHGEQKIKGCNLSLESDWSAAALWLVAGILAGESGVEKLHYDSLQADSLILDTFDACGADVGCYTYENEDTNICQFTANKSVCIPFEADLTHNPDLIGPFLLLALRCEGKSIIKGIGRLHTKESDRASSFVEEFRKLGAEIDVDKDKLIVTGTFGKKLHGGRVSSHHDHRLALALSIAGIISDEPIEIDDTECINKSWPFFNINV